MVFPLLLCYEQYVENQEGICGNATMMILGESTLASRFDLNESRMVMLDLIL